jgi:hypothetical protein
MVSAIFSGNLPPAEASTGATRQALGVGRQALREAIKLQEWDSGSPQAAGRMPTCRRTYSATPGRTSTETWKFLHFDVRKWMEARRTEAAQRPRRRTSANRTTLPRLRLPHRKVAKR